MLALTMLDKLERVSLEKGIKSDLDAPASPEQDRGPRVQI